MMKTILYTLIFLLGTGRAMAQPFTLDDKIQPVELKLEDYKKEDPKAKGRMASLATGQEADTAYYWVGGISMYSPVFFTITTSNPAADIKVNLCKENWLKAHRSGDIKGKGKWSSNFKTEGDFGIQVIARHKPVRYALLVWAGDEVKPDLPSPFANGAAAGKQSWISRHLLLVIVLVLALGVIGYLLYKLKNAKK